MKLPNLIKVLIGSVALAATPPLLLAQDSIQPETEAADESLTAEAEDLAAEATLYPVPGYGGDLFERAAMTGDWDGARVALATENGVQFAIDVNQFYFGIWDGGRSQESGYNGSSDYRIKLDLAKAGLWEGGFLEVHGETYWGSSVNLFTGAVLPVNTDPTLSLPAGNGTYLPHIVYTQFLAENFAVFGGKLDTTIGDANRFAHGVGNERFSNIGFSFNPVTLKTTPYSTLGAGFLYIPMEGVTASFTVLDADGLINQSGFDTVFNGNTTYGAELAIDTAFLEQSGRHTFGYAYSTKEFTSLDQDPRVLVPALDIAPSLEDSSWAFYYNFDQYLVSDPNDPNQGWGLFGRFGVSDGQANILHRFYSAGLGGTGVIPGRDRDRCGVGYYYLQLSDNRLGLLTDDNEQGVEIFYNIAVTPWFELTTDLQVVDGAGSLSDTAVIGGLRGRIIF